ncbi:phenylalanine--tRNA ligase subunit beta [Candidatus Endowatersipora endosymbiont of Watersipora subatra]|uniref:phenylalanine--tRNA ligase subunit beta n=1 Tax=Candidatus Endowatersipora endosymbiont of Watersipora subatra TaxID=3077946 RepID=UPI00312C9222
MKFTLFWLKDHLATKATLDEIAEMLTMIGLQVSNVDDRAALLPFTISRVLTVTPHPCANNLKILSIDLGKGEPLEVVSSAPNVHSGLIGVFASPGTHVPSMNLTSKVSNISGVISHGMMCSKKDLGLSHEDDLLIDLPKDAPVGMAFSDYEGLNDPVIEIDITPNRPDALSVLGIARDLAAAGLGTLNSSTMIPVQGTYDCPFEVDLSESGASEFCLAFGLIFVRNVQNKPSPKWMQQRLKAIGFSPISALVDITNYITLDRGRPLHLFDADKINGNLVIRRATGHEDFCAIDGKIYKPSSDHFFITDDKRPQSLAGIIGGKKSSCTDQTTNVLIESALWNPNMVARTGRDLNIITEARYRFERGVDPQFMRDGLNLCTKFVMELCGGEASNAFYAGSIPDSQKIIEFPLSETQRLTALEISKNTSATILRKLGFGVHEKGEMLTVTVPCHRPDIKNKADLVEEIMRIYGVDKIKPAPLPLTRSFRLGKRVLTASQRKMRNTRQILASRGMNETICYSFIPQSHAQAFGGGNPKLALSNPFSANMSDMRPSLLPGLLSATRRNVERGISDIAIFEVSHVYHDVISENQTLSAAGVRRGTARLESSGRHWSSVSTQVSVFDAKEDLFSVLMACGIDSREIHIQSCGPDWFHPGRSGIIKLYPNTSIGAFGEFHPIVVELLNLSDRLCGFEINLDAIPQTKCQEIRRKEALNLSNLQVVKRDLAFIVDKRVKSSIIVHAAREANKQFVSYVNVFDVFEGAPLQTNKKSIAIEVTLQPINKSFTDEEIESIIKSVISNVSISTGGELRV